MEGINAPAPPCAWVVAVDGPGGSGKSTVARTLAQRLHSRYLDTGAMYRALTWAVLEARVDLEDADAVTTLAVRTHLGISTDPQRAAVQVAGTSVTRIIREAPVTNAVSVVSAVPAVRDHLVRLQRQLICAEPGGIVVEGRDIGTVVAPRATVKVFLTASPEARARRRSRQLGHRTAALSGRIAEDLRRRDAYDSGRAASPLRRAPDALELDSTDLSVAEVVALVLGHCAEAGITVPA